MRPNNLNPFEPIESFLTLLFAVSIFVWKPGMYVSAGLITLYLLVRTGVDRDYRQLVWASSIAKVSLAVFALGLITASIGAENLDDVTWMARKTLFLPAVVFFVFALRNDRNKNIALGGLTIGFWVATLVTLNAQQWQLHFGDRIAGPWPIGTWDALMGLFFTFMAVSFKWSGTHWLLRLVHLTTLAMSLVMLVIAGGRAPWVGALVSLAAYFVLLALLSRDKRTVTYGIITVAVVATLGLTVFQDKTRPVIDRLSTVADTSTEGSSNWIRLQLWSIGLAHLEDLAANNKTQLLFGGGAESYNAKQIEFFKTMPFDESAREILKGHDYPSGDAHNNYIDSALRHGVVWTVVMTLYLIWLSTRFRLAYIRDNLGQTILLLNLLVMALFYTVFPHFLTFFFVLFQVLLASNAKLNTDSPRQPLT